MSRLPNGSEPLSADLSNPDEDKYLTRLQNNLEFFEGVPAISFSWVALLILFYILLIGPIEYLILTRLLKRLELTWLTFPIIIVGDQRDRLSRRARIQGPRTPHQQNRSGRDRSAGKASLRRDVVYGFSARAFRISPSASNRFWRRRRPQDTLVSWHGKAKSSRQSLFRRTYSYHTSTIPTPTRTAWSKCRFKCGRRNRSTRNGRRPWTSRSSNPLCDLPRPIRARSPAPSPVICRPRYCSTPN